MKSCAFGIWRAWVCAGLVAGAAGAQAQAVRPALLNDVFSRPRLGAPAAAPTAAIAPVGMSAASASSEAAAPAWRPPLRAVVMAGPRSMALVDRAVVEVGERIDGYRLDAVDEDSAVFTKGRQRVVLFLGKQRDPE